MVLLLLLLLIGPPALMAQSPALFEAVQWERHPAAYYEEQAKRWQAAVADDCSEDDDWYHYFKFAQYANRFGEADYDLDDILAEAERSCSPNSFALAYLRFARDLDLTTRYEKLLDAHRIDTNRVEAFTGLIAYYTLAGNHSARNRLLHRLQREHPIPHGVMEYNYNQLQSVGPAGLLFTIGDADTYPSWILQTVFGKRTDVEVVNLSLMDFRPDYRQRKLGEWGISLPNETYDRATLFAALHRAGRTVYCINTVNPDDLGPQMRSRFFLTGLAFRYAEPGYRNLPELVNNFERRWRLDQLTMPIADHPAQAVADELNRNYLPALLELRQFYDPASQQAKRVHQIISGIAKRAGLSKSLSSYLDGDGDYAETKPIASDHPELTAKQILMDYRPIPSAGKRSFLMGATEISNHDYQLFLNDLLRQRRFDLLDSARILPVRWQELVPPDTWEKFTPPDTSLEGLRNHPVVNVSHGGAELYARWLTEVYNRDEKRKDPRRVRFRLPTPEEFWHAYRGGRHHAPYPWGGPYFANNLGCILANFRTWDLPATDRDKINLLRAADKKKRGNCSEVLLTNRVDGYFPNDYGLYNMAGNVSEMTATRGFTVGGSWLDPIEDIAVEKTKKRHGPHPALGFRLIMEYLD